MPASLQDYDSYFTPLLRALRLDTEPKVVVGWGDGARYALKHAWENMNTTTDLVIMDASPDGIEWLDAQRANKWDEKQMLEYRQQDLQGRISLCRLILGLAIPWYVFSQDPRSTEEQESRLTLRIQGLDAYLLPINTKQVFRKETLRSLPSPDNQGRFVGKPILLPQGYGKATH